MSSRTSLVQDEEDAECTFAPQINRVPGVESTMGDFMQGWAERCRERRLEAAMERRRNDLVELEAAQPQQFTRAANEVYLREAGYSGPVQAWRLHADRYFKARQPSLDVTKGSLSFREMDVSSLSGNAAAEGDRQAHWDAVVRRLYPYSSTPDQTIIEGDEGSASKPTRAERLCNSDPVAMSLRMQQQSASEPRKTWAGPVTSTGGGSSSSSRGSIALPLSRSQTGPQLRPASSSAAASRRSLASTADTMGGRRTASTGRVSTIGASEDLISANPEEVEGAVAQGTSAPAAATTSQIGGNIEFLEVVASQNSGRRAASESSSSDGGVEKAPWQKMYEAGTLTLRARSQPPKVAGAAAPRPLPRSEQLLRNAQTPRKPLVSNHRGDTPQRCTHQPAANVSNMSTQSRGAPGGRTPGLRLYEQSERTRAMQQQRASVATALKSAEELRECTFCPKTNSSRTSMSPDAARESLYERGLKAKQRRREMSEQGVRNRVEQDMRECTFQPNIRREKSQERQSGRQSVSRSGQRHAAPGEEMLNGSDKQPQDLTQSVLSLLQDWKSKRPNKDLNLGGRASMTPGSTCEAATRRQASVPTVPSVAPMTAAPAQPCWAVPPSQAAGNMEVGALLNGWRESWAVDGASRSLPKAPAAAAHIKTAPSSPAGTANLPSARSVEVPSALPPDSSSSDGKRKPGGGGRVAAAAASLAGNPEASLAAMLQEWRSGQMYTSEAVGAGVQ
eukprot:CAMPEP_0178442010 /NCGR_PEP_ID=MMETSP0689_2-20121128/37885_1 /TAXON_ID=160604 /ORGANISM="Amphidinium massartii, Strain CS-259" /LENGTH=732 /DNA_ID=CAMNT_0020065425 /DNA_START=30 /DNA_END=2228 /DNA_ORIENTATION=-